MDESYIARDKCGCIVGAVVDVPEHKREVAREVSEWIRDGLAVERVTADYIRKNFTICPHTKKEGVENESTSI